MAVDTELPQPGGPHTRQNAPSQGTPHGATIAPPIAPHRQPPEPTTTEVPAGVHPNDSAGEWQEGWEGLGFPTEHSGEPYKKGRKPFAMPNGEAFPVNQRAARNFRVSTVAVNSNMGGTSQVVGRLAGRRSLTLWVPAQLVVGGVLLTPTNGIMYADTEGELQNGGGAFLAIGDAATIESESAVFVGLPPSATTAYAQYQDLYDAPGGGITGNT